jgi:hypothetical protein
MIPANYLEIAEALRTSLKRFPNCSVAGCACNSKGGQWRAGCYCLCHLLQMDPLYGKKKWTLKDFFRQCKKGIQPED